MMRRVVLLLHIILAGCASIPVTPSEQFFDDRLFLEASERISADDVFALNDEMKRYLGTEIAAEIRTKGSQQGLFDALYSQGQLKLEFDSRDNTKRGAGFADRSGNCLSLVIMTAAFAKEMGLPVRYQSAVVDEIWTATATSIFSSGTSTSLWKDSVLRRVPARRGRADDRFSAAARNSRACARGSSAREPSSRCT